MSAGSTDIFVVFVVVFEVEAEPWTLHAGLSWQARADPELHVSQSDTNNTITVRLLAAGLSVRTGCDFRRGLARKVPLMQLEP